MKTKSKPVDVVVLCGACKGEDIPKYRTIFPGRLIYAIEPMPRNVEKMKVKYGKDKDVIIIPKACWIKNETVKLKDYNMSYKHSLYVRPRDMKAYVGEIEVEAMDFAEFIDQFDKVDNVRMNIEGSEYEVLLHCFEKGVMPKIKKLEVQFHAHKIPELSWRDKLLRAKLKSLPKGQVEGA